MERLTGKMTAHASQVCDLVSIPKLAQQEVALRVNTGLAANPSLEANIFSGILEGVTGRLGLSPPRRTPSVVIHLSWLEWVYPDNGLPPSERPSRRQKGGHFMWDWSLTTYYPPRLRLDYDLGLETRCHDIMAPVLTPSLLSGLTGNIVGL